MSRLLTLLVSLLIAGCSAPAPQENKQSGYMAHTSNDKEIEAMTSSVAKYLGQSGNVVFSNIFSLRPTHSRGDGVGLTCALVRHEEWEPGVHRNVHYRNGEFSLIPSSLLAGACDPSRYRPAPGFTMISGVTVSNVEGAQDEPRVETSDEESPVNVGRDIVDVSDQHANHAKHVIQEMLKDPESARFRRIYGARGGVRKIAICGEVNAKNSYGGYTGYKPFMVFENGDRGFIWDSSEIGYSFDNMLISQICPTY